MKKLALILFLCAVPMFGQAIEFLNYDSTTTLPQYRDYTVRYRVNPNYASQAWHVWFTQQAGATRYTIPLHDCDIPPYAGGGTSCNGQFTFFVNASIGAKLRLWATTYIPGLQDVSGYATVVRPTTSVKDTASVASVAPNPASDIVSVACTRPPREVVLFTSAGKEVYRYAPLRDILGVRFDVSGLPSGEYFVRIRTDNATETSKIIVVH